MATKPRVLLTSILPPPPLVVFGGACCAVDAPHRAAAGKAEMDVAFKANQKRAGDPGFTHNVQKSFSPIGASGWDSSGSDGGSSSGSGSGSEASAEHW